MVKTAAWIAPAYDEAEVIEALGRTFAESSAVLLRGIFAESAGATLAASTGALRDTMRRRAFVMPTYGTPRVMRVMGGSSLTRAIPELAEIYEAALLLVERIVRIPVYPCTHPEEFAVLNRLEGVGATHGWHCDNGAYALTFVLEAPASGAGGAVEYVPHWRQVCAEHGLAADTPVDAAVEVLRAFRCVKTIPLHRNDAYLLRADHALHRVTPLLLPDAARLVLNLAFQDAPSSSYDGTADLLYG